MSNTKTTTPNELGPSIAKADLASRIKKQGKKPEHMPVAALTETAEAGSYKVVHGSVRLGYGDDGGVVDAHKGAIVELDAAEATRMLDEGTVAHVSA